MGCDGGTIPKRHELIRTKKKKEAKDKDSDLQWKWRYCSLSNLKLKDPIVACELGRFYNKDAVIEYLLDKNNSKYQFKHIRGLKDIYTLVLARNSAWQGGSLKGDTYIDTHLAPFICPVAGIEMNGKYKFSFLLKCKCVLSERAIKEVRGSTCPSCSTEYDKDCDVIILNPSEDEERELIEKMERRREIARAERLKKKKEKKREIKDKNNEQKNLVGGNIATTSSGEPSNNKLSISNHCTGPKNGVPGTSGSQNGVPGTSGSQNGVPGTSGPQNGVPGTSGPQNGVSTGSQNGGKATLKSDRVKSLSAASTVLGAKHKLKEEKIFKTKTFMSLFTSHESAKRAKDKNGHWITYNPYHYSG